jgi:predicted nucleotidyltransferase
MHEPLISEITRRLVAAVPARSRIVLFGSRARGENGPHSDVDVLVIEPSLADAACESARLRTTLDGLRVPVDVVVVGAGDAQRRAAVRGTLVDRALREGQVLADT